MNDVIFPIWCWNINKPHCSYEYQIWGKCTQSNRERKKLLLISLGWEKSVKQRWKIEFGLILQTIFIYLACNISLKLWPRPYSLGDHVRSHKTTGQSGSFNVNWKWTSFCILPAQSTLLTPSLPSYIVFLPHKEKPGSIRNGKIILLNGQQKKTCRKVLTRIQTRMPVVQTL